MIALPVSFYMMMIFSLILTAPVFSNRLNVLFNPISTNHKGLLSAQMVPCCYRVSYPAGNPSIV